MTIDESIEYELNGGVVPPTKYIQVYREQIIEWLEELKSLRSASELWEHNNNLAYAQGRNDAIDEFYDEVLNFEDYIEPVDTSENGAVLLYSGKDITDMIVKIKKQMIGK